MADTCLACIDIETLAFPEWLSSQTLMYSDDIVGTLCGYVYTVYIYIYQNRAKAHLKLDSEEVDLTLHVLE